jgi:threonine aldolase
MIDIDLRSDTVTKPSPAMRQAMAQAEVGDDVYGEDPTVQQLESTAAMLLGKEAALFVPSGTMANQVAILTHTHRGDEIFIHRDSHAYYYEAGAAAMWSGATFNLLNGPDGYFSAEDLADAVRPANIHHPRPRLVLLENTHNRAGGAAISLDRILSVSQCAHQLGLRVHIDGARLYNASIALNQPVALLAGPADSVSLCLSKGLGAPVGSILAGTWSFVEQARRYRKSLGGGMRQAGILAAAGLVALEEGPALIVEDHRRARKLKMALEAMGFDLVVPEIPTNMLFIRTAVPAEDQIVQLKRLGVLATQMGSQLIRLVTHRDLNEAAIERAITIFGSIAP